MEEGIERVVISYMILPRDSFRLSRAYRVNGLGCLNMFYLAFDYELTPYELMCTYYVYTYTLMRYMQYLLSVTYVILCTDFVLGWGLSNECVVAQPLHLFLFPRCDCYWWPVVLYSIM